MKTCPHCGGNVSPEQTTCNHCFRSVATTIHALAFPSAGPMGTPAAFALRKILWVGALVLMLLSAAESFFSFELQTGAPQQGAAAAYACFRLIAIYVVARAMDELTRGRQGV